MLVSQRVSAQRAPVLCILGCCLSNLHAYHPRAAGLNVIALPGLVARTPHCIRVATQVTWGGGRFGGAHTGHAQVRIKLGCLANAPACMMGWVTHTSTLEQLILQDLSLSLHWSCKCCSACKILLSEFQTQAEHHRLPASRRARAVAKEASLAAERLQKMTLHDGCPRALNCARTHARTRARTHTHAHTNAHTRTNTHTHMRAHN